MQLLNLLFFSLSLTRAKQWPAGWLPGWLVSMINYGQKSKSSISEPCFICRPRPFAICFWPKPEAYAAPEDGGYIREEKVEEQKRAERPKRIKYKSQTRRRRWHRCRWPDDKHFDLIFIKIQALNMQRVNCGNKVLLPARPKAKAH